MDISRLGSLRRSWFPERIFGAATDGLSALVLFSLMVMTCVDVFGREAIGEPLDGATELTQIMMGILVFGVLPVISYRNDHVTVDLLDKYFPERLVPARATVLGVIGAVIMAVVCWRVWIIGGFQTEYGDATEFLAIPLGPISHFIAAMSGVTAIALLAGAFLRTKTRNPLDSQPPST